MNGLVILFYLLLYVLPFVIGAYRRVDKITRLFVVNIFLGWTVIGWFIALVWAIFEPSYKEKKKKKKKKNG